MIGTARALELHQAPPSTLLLAAEMRKLGQDLFHPPNVFGWPEGREWIHTRSVLGRHGFVDALLAGKLHASEHAPIDFESLSERHGFAGQREAALKFTSLLFSNQTKKAEPTESEAGRNTSAELRARRDILQIMTDPENQLS